MGKVLVKLNDDSEIKRLNNELEQLKNEEQKIYLEFEQKLDAIHETFREKVKIKWNEVHQRLEDKGLIVKDKDGDYLTLFINDKDGTIEEISDKEMTKIKMKNKIENALDNIFGI